MENRLTDKQLRFANTFLMTGDRYKALAEAGYSLAHKSVTASQLLANAKIKQYLDTKTKDLVMPNINEITAIVKGLDKKEAACLEIYKCYQDIKDSKNPTKYKWMELLCKLKGHFNESGNVNLFVTQDGKNLSVADIMEGTGRLTGVLREIRFEAEIMRKRKSEPAPIDIVATDVDTHN